MKKPNFTETWSSRSQWERKGRAIFADSVKAGVVVLHRFFRLQMSSLITWWRSLITRVTWKLTAAVRLNRCLCITRLALLKWILLVCTVEKLLRLSLYSLDPGQNLHSLTLDCFYWEKSGKVYMLYVRFKRIIHTRTTICLSHGFLFITSSECKILTLVKNSGHKYQFRVLFPTIHTMVQRSPWSPEDETLHFFNALFCNAMKVHIVGLVGGKKSKEKKNHWL